MVLNFTFDKKNFKVFIFEGLPVTVGIETKTNGFFPRYDMIRFDSLTDAMEYLLK